MLKYYLSRVHCTLSILRWIEEAFSSVLQVFVFEIQNTTSRECTTRYGYESSALNPLVKPLVQTVHQKIKRLIMRYTSILAALTDGGSISPRLDFSKLSILDQMNLQAIENSLLEVVR